MIQLLLQMFGGGGSGSGGGGGGSGSPGHHGSAGGTGHYSGGNHDSEGKGGGKVSGPVTGITDPNAVYIIYNARGKALRKVRGSALIGSIKREEMRYNPRTGKWETRTGARLTIRKKI